MQDTYNIQEWGSWKKTDATNLKMLFVVYVYFKQDSNSFQTTFIATLRFFFINILFYVGAKSRRGGKEKPDLVFVVACCECQWNQKPVLDVLLQLLPAKFQDSITLCNVVPCCLNLNIFQKCFF